MENYELGYRKNVKTSRSSLVSPNFRKSAASNEIEIFSKKKTSATNGLSIEILMNETLQVFLEKKEFESFGQLKLLAFCGIFGLSEFSFREHIKWLPNWDLLHR